MLELLPNATVPPGCPSSIKHRTTVKWLHNLGFRPQSHKKDIYIDGHERSDVIEYRTLYLRKLDILEKTHLPPPPCPGGLTQFVVGDSGASKHLKCIWREIKGVRTKAHATLDINIMINKYIPFTGNLPGPKGDAYGVTNALDCFHLFSIRVI